MVIGILVTVGIGFAIGLLSPSLRIAIMGGVLYFAVDATWIAIYLLDGVDAGTGSLIVHLIPVGLPMRVLPALAGFAARRHFQRHLRLRVAA